VSKLRSADCSRRPSQPSPTARWPCKASSSPQLVHEEEALEPALHRRPRGDRRSGELAASLDRYAHQPRLLGKVVAYRPRRKEPACRVLPTSPTT
jgi:hypothetical protein